MGWRVEGQRRGVVLSAGEGLSEELRSLCCSAAGSEWVQFVRGGCFVTVVVIIVIFSDSSSINSNM